MKISAKAIFVGLSLLSIFVLSGCNTVSGFGKDMQQGGKELQKAAAKGSDNDSKSTQSTANDSK